MKKLRLSLIQARCFKLASPAMEAKIPTDRVAAYLTAERQHIASLRPEDDVLAVDSSFYATGLVRPFKMATQLVAILYELH